MLQPKNDEYSKFLTQDLTTYNNLILIFKFLLLRHLSWRPMCIAHFVHPTVAALC